MKTTKSLIVISYFLTSSLFAATSPASSTDSNTNSVNDPCHIEVYEKTPGCYVTDEGNGCLTISDQKPVCTKKSCTFTVPGCEVKTTYKSGGAAQ